MRSLLPLLALGCVHEAPPDPLAARLDSEVQAAHARNDILESRLARCTDEAMGIKPELARQLYQVFADTEVQVERRENLTLLIFPGALLFPNDSLTLRQEALPMLDLLATALALHPDQRVWVVGYADRPPKPSNLARLYPTVWEWSAAQADVIMRTLVQKFDMDAARFVIAGRGDASPLSTDDTPEAHALNRRVEVVFGATLP